MATATKTQRKRTETRAIVECIEANESILTAREQMTDAIGSEMKITGRIEKYVKRNGLCRFIIIDRTTAREMTIYADLSADAETVGRSKPRKGKTAEIVGRLHSFGFYGINLTDCKLKKI